MLAMTHASASARSKAAPVSASSETRPIAKRHLRIDRLASQDHLHRLIFADGPEQTLRSTCAGHDADANLWLTESRSAPRDNHVAGKRQFAATAQRITLDRSNHGLAACNDGPEYAARVARRMFAGSHVHHLNDVSAADEERVPASQHDHSHVQVSVRCGKRLVELPLDVKAERIAALGAINANDGNTRLGTLADHDVSGTRF